MTRTLAWCFSLVVCVFLLVCYEFKSSIHASVVSSWLRLSGTFYGSGWSKEKRPFEWSPGVTHLWRFKTCIFIYVYINNYNPLLVASHSTYQLTSIIHGSAYPSSQWIHNGLIPNQLQTFTLRPSLKLTAKAPENRPSNPKRKRENIPTIHFQGLLLLVSGRVVQVTYDL